ncbi:MAG: patatin-like phospholipase family protein [Halanaerobiales bacterium]|nr:patatin-like phospholipase family protein [Halanaerobiales bacterium]
MYGLILEGGGAKGSYQIGAYQAIEQLSLGINGVAGTSIGALNGAMIVQGEWERIYELWYNISPSLVFRVDDQLLEELLNFDLSQENLLYLLKKAKRVFNNRGLDIGLIKKILVENIREEAIRAAKKDFGIVAFNLSEMKALELFLEDIPVGKLVNYLMASAYFPAFKLERMEGKFFLDGGVYDNLPITLLGSRGYRDLIVIRTYGRGRIRKFPQQDYNITYIKPVENLGGILDFSQDRARKNLKMGYFDALRVFQGLAGSKYYLEATADEDYYLRLFLKLGQEKISRIGQLFGLEPLPYQRLLFEFIIPRLTVLLDLKRDCSYREIALSLLERVAEKLAMERFRIYQLEEFMAEIIRNFPTRQQDASKHIPEFIRQHDLLSRAVRDELLQDIITVIFS